MCGIAGIFGMSVCAAQDGTRPAIVRMTDTLHHRGPNSSGLWTDREVGIALGHRRLAIIDVSSAGHQPMVSSTERYVIVYNGEIYNFRDIRKELTLLGATFRGDSDTEVLLMAVEQWGFEGALVRLVGMFAIAIWDRQCAQLLLARDRLGKKPLYLGYCLDNVVFASELKAIACLREFDRTLDDRALALFLRNGYVPGPLSIYRSVIKLPPGTWIVIDRDALEDRDSRSLIRRSKPYWSLGTVVQNGRRDRVSDLSMNAVDDCEMLVREAVGQRMVADVPLGAFLSGGVDSALVVAMMQAQSSRKVRTFTVGFHEGGFDESAEARSVARYLETDHTEFYCQPRDVLDFVPTLSSTYDEPFADSSQLPSMVLSSMTRSTVTVALSGDGGDESFGGYARYALTSRIGPIYRVPLALRSLAAACLSIPTVESWDRIINLFSGLIPLGITGDRILKFADMLTLPSEFAFYHSIMQHWSDETQIPYSINPEDTLNRSSDIEWSSNELFEQMMYCDTITYLPDDILVKVDRASMAFGLEVRCPLLDQRLVEFAWHLPLNAKVRGGHGKWILREILSRYLPRSLFERPKHGFSVPIESWLRGPLRPWAEELVDESRLRQAGLLRAAPIRKRWMEHLSGSRNWSASLWTVLMFQAWHERWQGTSIT